MSIKLADILAPMADFPAAMAEHIEFNDGKNLQEVLDEGIIGGVELTQAEYDALTDEEKKNGLEYRCTDSGRIYINDILYSRKKEVELETYAEYKALKEAGLVEADVDYVVHSNESGALLSDLDTNHGDSEISTYEVIETLKSDVENLIDDTKLTSTTSTLSANKIKNAVTYSFDTQNGNVKYVKFKPSITTVSVVDIYGGKIEILGASKASSNPDYKTVKVVRLSYGDWGSYDATQVPSVVHTKIGELYYYPTDEYYYLKLYNYAAFTMRGLVTAPEVITSLPAEESAMILIPETDWGKIDDTSTNTTSTWSSSKIASEINPTIDISKVFSNGALNIATLCSTYGNGRYVIVGQGTAGNGSATIDIWTLASQAISYIVNVTYSNKTSNTFIGLTYENPTINFEANYLNACNHIAKVCTLA